jgi:hypothetical protein
LKTALRHILTRDENHIYRLGTVRKYGFSEICASMRVGEEDCRGCREHSLHTHSASFWTDDGKEQGKALHKWLLFLASGRDTDQPVEIELAGRVAAIRKFIKDTKFRLSFGETPQYDAATDTACTPDIWGYIGPWAWVIDAKRGAKMKIHELQTACQKIALASYSRFHAQKRGSLYLMDNGDYRLVEHTDRADEQRWRAIAAAFHAKKSYQE